MRLSTALKVIQRAHDTAHFDTLVLFVTSICNAKCGTCFYWQSLNQKGDLTLDELGKISRSMPAFRNLLLSGGEPTLRRDLVEVVRLFVEHNRIVNVSMPTNGLLPERVVEVARGLLDLDPLLGVAPGVSIDGPGATHDEIRGVPGNYVKAIDSLERLLALREQAGRRLSVSVTSVVCSRNLGEIEGFAERLFAAYDLDAHNLVLIRGEPMLRELLIDEPAAIESFRRFHYDLVRRYQARRASRRGSLSFEPGRLWERGFALESLDITYRNFTRGEAWPFPCLAGQIIGVIDWNGDVRACELRPPVASLRAYGLDFSRLWAGPEMQAELAAIRRDRCFCTHGCFLQPSQEHNIMSSLVRGPLKGIADTLGRRPS
jgi:MoaA/NifB/PqqE/SkfB family radical SAM enzyme